jgi:probable phosphoglycerate mutase|tara:strand:- start:1630 stop:2202 length:573 start_codon:yes stop_codon:yes gene_type:complete
MNADEDIKIFLIRHGEAGKSWNEDPDPGLSQKGKEQSEDLKIILNEEYSNSNFDVVSSPLLRAQETAIPLKEQFNCDIIIDKTFGEIPSPGVPLSQRSVWLKNIFETKIDDLEDAQSLWRDKIINKIQNLDNDTLIFCHFMVINCIVSWLENSDTNVSFYPNYCSITKLLKTRGSINLIEKGRELDTLVN